MRISKEDWTSKNYQALIDGKSNTAAVLSSTEINYPITFDMDFQEMDKIGKIFTIWILEMEI
eukprot:Awhi_evm2s2819